MPSEKYPLTTAPNPNKAFAYGEDPNTSHRAAQEALLVAQDITADTINEPADRYMPAVKAALRGVDNAVANVNMLKVPEARRVVAARHELIGDLDSMYPMTSVEGAAVRPEAKQFTSATETDRQMGIAKAARANRVAAGLPPAVLDLK